MEKFVQEFRKVTRDNGYKERLLVEEFKEDKKKVDRSKMFLQKY